MTTTSPEPYVYRLRRVVKVIDGDTIDLDLDLGFFLSLRQRVRLIGIDAPETRTIDTDEKSRGLQAQAHVLGWFERSGQVLVRTTKEEKYGRMLADCFRVGEPSLCTELLELGLAVPYQG